MFLLIYAKSGIAFALTLKMAVPCLQQPRKHISGDLHSYNTAIAPNSSIGLKPMALPLWENLMDKLFLLHYCYVFQSTLEVNDTQALANAEKSCWKSIQIVCWITLFSEHASQAACVRRILCYERSLILAPAPS